MNAPLKYFQFSSLLQQEGWISPAYAGVDDQGIIRYLSNKAPLAPIAMETVQGLALPGFQNAHSHAFQYSLAGLAEHHPAGTTDDFWTWREAMYRCALSVDPDQAEAIAAMVYAEMVRVGYSHVAEFHYLHHDRDGRPYSNVAELGARMIAAAQKAGIKITLIPVFYQKGGFGQEPQSHQRRFISKSIDDYFRLLSESESQLKNYSDASLGFSVHSLRAVSLPDIQMTLMNGPETIPFHMHVAEQKKEVTDCLAHCGARPVQWALANLPVSSRFHLVHATHLDDAELALLAKSGAHVVLCPSTEGNLGDGIFRMKEYAKLNGHWSMGTDSHIGLQPLEEFRMIDYRQRLITHHRNTFDGDAAGYMIRESLFSGRRAMGIESKDFFELGRPFDAVIYNAQNHLLTSTSPPNRLATLLYTSDSSRIIGTIINGKWVVKNQHHVNGASIKSAFAKAMREIKLR
jgi:formimidoylglutamate deiminase